MVYRGVMLGPDFQRVFEALPSAHMVLDREFRYVAANAAYEKSVMRKLDELVGQNLFDLFPNDGESGERLRASFQRVIDTAKPDTLAFIPYDIPRAASEGGGLEVRYWTATHSPLVGADGKVTHIIQNTVDVTELVRLREAAVLPFPARSGALVEKAREAEQAHRQLLAESEEFRRLFRQAPGFMAVMSGPTHVFVFANDAYVSLVGGRDVLGRSVKEALPEIEGQGFYELLDSVYSTGKDHSANSARVMLRDDTGRLREAFVDFSYAPIRDHDGNVTGVFVQGMDRTDAVRAEQRQKLLLDEVNHRVKNTLATVQSIAAQTLRNAKDLVSARGDFERRIITLSRTHNLLSDTQWSNASLGALVEAELAALGGPDKLTGGPTIMLNPKASIALSMTLHELAANAARLALSGGAVADVAWDIVRDDGSLLIDWQESEGDERVASERAGVGARMIQRLIEGELDGHYQVAQGEGRVSHRISIPADAWGGGRDHVG